MRNSSLAERVYVYFHHLIIHTSEITLTSFDWLWIHLTLHQQILDRRQHFCRKNILFSKNQENICYCPNKNASKMKLGQGMLSLILDMSKLRRTKYPSTQK